MKHLFATAFVFLLCSVVVIAQPAEQLVKVRITPDSPSWTYGIGASVTFKIEILRNSIHVPNSSVTIEYGPEMMDPVMRENRLLKEGVSSLVIPGMKVPGFLRVTVTAYIDGKSYEGLCTVGFDPDKIKVTAVEPTNFDSFWKNAIEENRRLPLDIRMDHQPLQSTEKVDVYHVSFQNYRSGWRIYGWLCLPKGEGKYPALLHLPGAGVWKLGADVENASKGVITLTIGIHGIPLTAPMECYESLRTGSLANYSWYGLDSRDNYFYKRVYLASLRAVDCLTSLPQYDGKWVAVEGNSQGGALSLVVAGMDTRIRACVAHHPALSDLTGYLYGRAGGWPHIFKGADPKSERTRILTETLGYYDVVHFARRISATTLFVGGYNDKTCPPTSFWAAYNSITSSKSFALVPETGHWIYPEQREELNQFLMNVLFFNSHR